MSAWFGSQTVEYILDTYKTVVKSASVYSYESRGWCWSCDLRNHGVPRVMKGIKWFRNEEEISELDGFTPLQMELLIEVIFVYVNFRGNDIHFSYQVRLAINIASYFT